MSFVTNLFKGVASVVKTVAHVTGDVIKGVTLAVGYVASPVELAAGIVTGNPVLTAQGALGTFQEIQTGKPGGIGASIADIGSQAKSGLTGHKVSVGSLVNDVLPIAILAAGVKQAAAPAPPPTDINQIDQFNSPPPAEIPGTSIMADTTSVAGAAADTTGSITDYISSAAGGVYGALQSLVGVSAGSSPAGTGIVGYIQGIVGDLANFVSTIVTPVANAVHDVSTIAQQINDTIVQPIANTINASEQLITGIKSGYDELVKGGISAFADVSNKISSALTGADAVFGRSIQQLGEFNAQVVSGALVPGLVHGGLDQLAGIHDVLKSFAPSTVSDVGAVEQIKLGESPLPEDAIKAAQNWLDLGSGATGFWAPFYTFVARLINYLPTIEAISSPTTELVRQLANRGETFLKLDVGDAIEAFYRGIISQDDLLTELASFGWDGNRVKAFVELKAWLPTAREALELEAREAISTADANSILAKRGFTTDDITALRGSFLEPPSPASYILARARTEQGRTGFLASSYTQAPPADVQAVYRPRFLRTDHAEADWINHWKSPNIDWWLTAYFRGIRTYTELQAAARAEMMPEEIIADLPTVFGETIQQWMLPNILAAGIMSEQEALNYTKYIGMNERDGSILVNFGLGKASTAKAKLAGALKSLSLANASEMFDDGIIDAPTYLEVLGAHGYGDQEAALMLQLTQTKQQLADRKSEATALIDQVNNGAMTEADAQTALYKLGFTASEVIVYVAKIKRAKASQSKGPSEAQLTSMVKKSLIGQAVWAQAMLALGYVTAWLPLLYQDTTGVAWDDTIGTGTT